MAWLIADAPAVLTGEDLLPPKGALFAYEVSENYPNAAMGSSTGVSNTKYGT